jgi:hypothetical protein
MFCSILALAEIRERNRREQEHEILDENQDKVRTIIYIQLYNNVKNSNISIQVRIQ